MPCTIESLFPSCIPSLFSPGNVKRIIENCAGARVGLSCCELLESWRIISIAFECNKMKMFMSENILNLRLRFKHSTNNNRSRSRHLPASTIVATASLHDTLRCISNSDVDGRNRAARRETSMKAHFARVFFVLQQGNQKLEHRTYSSFTDLFSQIQILIRN